MTDRQRHDHDKHSISIPGAGSLAPAIFAAASVADTLLLIAGAGSLAPQYHTDTHTIADAGSLAPPYHTHTIAGAGSLAPRNILILGAGSLAPDISTMTPTTADGARRRFGGEGGVHLGSSSPLRRGECCANFHGSSFGTNLAAASAAPPAAVPTLCAPQGWGKCSANFPGDIHTSVPPSPPRFAGPGETARKSLENPYETGHEIPKSRQDEQNRHFENAGLLIPRTSRRCNNRHLDADVAMSHAAGASKRPPEQPVSENTCLLYTSPSPRD